MALPRRNLLDSASRISMGAPDVVDPSGLPSVVELMTAAVVKNDLRSTVFTRVQFHQRNGDAPSKLKGRLLK